MFNRIKLFFINNRNAIRVSGYSLISIILLYLTWLIDYKHNYIKDILPDILLLSPDVTSSFLSALTGTFLTVTTFTFTTILTVLGKYSTSFSPRTVQDFIDKPNVLSLLGIYIGGFFYTVLSLFMVQNIDSQSHLVSGTIAIFYAAAAMLSFVLFSKRVLHGFKVENVVEGIFEQADKLIKEEDKKRREAERFSTKDSKEEIGIYANKTGYLFEIDCKGLMEELDKGKCQLVVEKKINEYVSKGMYIASLYTYGDYKLDDRDKDDYLSKISECLVINYNKNDLKDYHHELTKLVEIAMMALSPGVNDPNTAIEVIEKISILLGRLFSTDNFYLILDEDEDTKIIHNGYTVEEELFLAYSQIVHYGKEDPRLSQALLKGLYMVYMIASKSCKKDVEDYLGYVYTTCKEALISPLDKKSLDIIYEDFKQNRDKRSSQEAVRDK